jgi:hypothetical protein
MFFSDPVAAFSNIAHALRQLARLILLVWQDDAHNPWIGEFPAAPRARTVAGAVVGRA